MSDQAKAFATRLSQACDKIPDIPAINHGEGRLGYIVHALKEKGTKVTMQSVSRWHNGEAVPRDKYLIPLAETLRVSPEWLRFGAGSSEQINEKSAIGTRHLYNLRGDYEVSILLPQDLTEREAERVARFITSLPIA